MAQRVAGVAAHLLLGAAGPGVLHALRVRRNEQSDLTPAQVKVLRSIVREEFPCMKEAAFKELVASVRQAGRIRSIRWVRCSTACMTPRRALRLPPAGGADGVEVTTARVGCPMSRGTRHARSFSAPAARPAAPASPRPGSHLARCWLAPRHRWCAR